MKLSDELQKEKVVGKCSMKKVFLKTSQNSHENTFVGRGGSRGWTKGNGSPLKFNF